MYGPSAKLDWEEIKTFLEVVRNGTVRTTARALGVHHSTVSRRIESLEKTLEVRLFDRRPEGYAPTSAGERLAQAAGLFADELGDVERQIAGEDQVLSGRIVVTMAEPIASGVFAEHLRDFCAAYPGLELEIICSYDLLDVSRREADIAIRLDNNPPDMLVGKRLFSYHTSIYCAPDYLEDRDLKADPESGRWIGWDSEEGRFPEWTRDTEFAQVPVWGAFANISMQTRLAAAGMGLTMIPCIVGDDHPGLIRATGRDPAPSRDIWILTHDDLRRTARIKAFMEFAETVLRRQKARFMGKAES